jgi:hypothetical protein
MLAYQINDNVQIGIDRFKSGPLKPEVFDIIDINTELTSHTLEDDLSSRGIGLELRVKLD